MPHYTGHRATLPIHNCGICDGPLQFTRPNWVTGYAEFTCTECGAWHTAKDCCSPNDSRSI